MVPLLAVCGYETSKISLIPTLAGARMIENILSLDILPLAAEVLIPIEPLVD